MRDKVFPARVDRDRGRARATLAPGNQVWSHYDEYQMKTEREIPVVVLTPIEG